MIVLAVLHTLVGGLLSLVAIVAGTVVDLGVEPAVSVLGRVPAGDRLVGLVRAAGPVRILAAGIVALSCLRPVGPGPGAPSPVAPVACRRRRPGTRGEGCRRRVVEAR